MIYTGLIEEFTIESIEFIAGFQIEKLDTVPFQLRYKTLHVPLIISASSHFRYSGKMEIFDRKYGNN